MKSFFVFDVESIGLHGEGFAVGGGVYLENGAAQWEFRFSCPLNECAGDEDDLNWVKENCPLLEVTHRCPKTLRNSFWAEWKRAKAFGATMAADCNWPVESRFLAQCVEDDKSRKWEGPYPFIDIGSVLLTKGKDPLGVFSREPSELPKHCPLADARQSARILTTVLAGGAS